MLHKPIKIIFWLRPVHINSNLKKKTKKKTTVNSGFHRIRKCYYMYSQICNHSRHKIAAAQFASLHCISNGVNSIFFWLLTFSIQIFFFFFYFIQCSWTLKLCCRQIRMKRVCHTVWLCEREETKWKRKKKY